MGAPPHPNPLPKGARGLYGAVGGFNAGFGSLSKGARGLYGAVGGFNAGFSPSPLQGEGRCEDSARTASAQAVTVTVKEIQPNEISPAHPAFVPPSSGGADGAGRPRRYRAAAWPTSRPPRRRTAPARE